MGGTEADVGDALAQQAFYQFRITEKKGKVICTFWKTRKMELLFHVIHAMPESVGVVAAPAVDRPVGANDKVVPGAAKDSDDAQTLERKNAIST